MAAKATQRPANRPSRRDDILGAAAQLLATDAPELVSVADIARHAGLTSAAIYYHFRSRDDLVDEIVTAFALEWSAMLVTALDELAPGKKPTVFIERCFDFVEADSSRAMVYFVSSIGVTLTSETVRRDTRYQLTREAVTALQRLEIDTTAADLTVRALGLITLLEVGAADNLRPSQPFLDLGKAKFRKAIVKMATKLIT